MLSSDFISKGDFPRQFQRQIRRTVFFIQLGMGGQAARIPLLAVKVIARVEKLEHVDSASVAVLLAWQKAARQNKLHLRFINTPESLISLASLYGVTELLALS